MENSNDQNIPKKKEGIESNPLGNAFDISVSIPDKVEIKMVNASILSDYEVWVFISSLISNAVIGFWVAYSSNTNDNADNVLFWNSILFTILFLVTISVALRKRYQLSKKSKSINLKTTAIEK